MSSEPIATFEAELDAFVRAAVHVHGAERARSVLLRVVKQLLEHADGLSHRSITHRRRPCHDHSRRAEK